MSFVKKSFNKPFEYIPEKDYDKLFQPHWENVKAWGIVKDRRSLAVVETAVEEWSNRLRVTELWIDDDYRRQGIGKALMNIAVKRARKEKRRAVFAEWYDNGHTNENDPNTCLLQIKLTDGVQFHNGVKYEIDFTGEKSDV